MIHKLSRKGVQISAEENPREVWQRLKKQHLYDEQQLDQVFATYEKLRYAYNESDATPAQVKQLSNRISSMLATIKK